MAKKNNTMLYIGLGAAALGLFYFLKKRKSGAEEGAEDIMETAQRGGAGDEIMETESTDDIISPVQKVRSGVKQVKDTVEEVKEAAQSFNIAIKKSPQAQELLKRKREERRKKIQAKREEARKRRAMRKSKRKAKRVRRRRKKSLGQFDFI